MEEYLKKELKLASSDKERGISDLTDVKQLFIS
jgi:hypothetical protein